MARRGTNSLAGSFVNFLSLFIFSLGLLLLFYFYFFFFDLFNYWILDNVFGAILETNKSKSVEL